MAGIFDDQIFDEDIFDIQVDAPVVATSVDPAYQARWLLDLEVNGRTTRLSDLPGEVSGNLYRSGIVNVSVSESGIDLENRTAAIGDVSIDLTSGILRFDPRYDLKRAKARLSLLVEGVVIPIIEGPTSDVRRGRAWIEGETAEVHSFKITETFVRNPTFPPRIADEKRFGAQTIDPSAEGKALTQVFGDALTVPMFAVRALVEPDGALQYLICGHRLRGGRPAPENGMPWAAFPDRADLQDDMVIGAWVGRNRVVRDPLRTSLHGGWTLTGTVTPEATGTVIATSSELRWNAWRFIPAVSWGWYVENAGAGSGSGRGFTFFWGYRDSQNLLRAVFNIQANTVKIEVLKENVVDWTSEVQTPSPALSNSQTEYRLIVDETRGVTIGIGDQRISMGEVPGIHHGYFGFTSQVESHRFAALRMPHERPRGIIQANLNAGVVYGTDDAGDRYVAEEYDEDVSLPLYAETRAAQGVSTAAELLEFLVLRHSGYKQDEIDEGSFHRARFAIPLRIGSWFAEEARLFDLIQQRLSPQFLAWVVQEAGQLRIIAINPNAPPEQHLRLHRDLLECVDQPAVLEDRTQFEIRYRWRENLATGPGYARKLKLGPDEVPALRAHENRLPGPVEYPMIETVDVLHDATANQILSRYATIFWQGEEVAYLRRTTAQLLPYGTIVDITDLPNGYDAQRAILLRRRFESPNFMVETFRTLHPLDDPIVQGAVGVDCAWDLATAGYTGKSFSVSAQQTSTQGLFFSPDGTKMYVFSDTADPAIFQYTLSTAWDVSTASYASKSFSVEAQETAVHGLFFSSDGTKMYVMGAEHDTIFQYTLSTAWDVSTASYASKSFSVSAQDTLTQNFFLSSDGTRMYFIGFITDTIFQYTLSTAWDISTASYTSKSFSVAAQEPTPHGLSFEVNGRGMYIVGAGGVVYQYALGIPWDLLTAIYTAKSFSVASEEVGPQGLFFSPDGLSMYVDGTGNMVYQYELCFQPTPTGDGAPLPGSMIPTLGDGSGGAGSCWILNNSTLELTGSGWVARVDPGDEGDMELSCVANAGNCVDGSPNTYLTVGFKASYSAPMGFTSTGCTGVEVYRCSDDTLLAEVCCADAAGEHRAFNLAPISGAWADHGDVYIRVWAVAKLGGPLNANTTIRLYEPYFEFHGSTKTPVGTVCTLSTDCCTHPDVGSMHVV